MGGSVKWVGSKSIRMNKKGLVWHRLELGLKFDQVIAELLRHDC